MLKVFEQYSAATLAQISGYNPETIAQMRRGNRPVTKHALKKLRLALVSHGYNVEGLFDERGEAA